MKAYLITTGLVFALIIVAHVMRMFAEGSHVALDPWFLGITALTCALFVWAMVLLRRMPRSSRET